jgi:pyruvate,orthophosphate dikinase
MSKKYVFYFGEGKAEGNTAMKNILGGKGANLAEMTNLGVPVPPGFTISAEVCDYYNKHNGNYPEELEAQVKEALNKLENMMGKKLGDPNDPLLVSVRSGAAVSMPGMMDTVLNLGLNPDSVQGMIKKTGNERFARDSYRRFITMFSNVVMGMDTEDFENIMDEIKEKKGVEHDTELDANDLKELADRYLKLYKEKLGEDFPLDPKDQLWKAINAVFGSWNNKRAITYRKLHNITGLLGTAVNVQSMVFGNMGENSGTGVAFSRNPSTGENIMYGEYLMNAQGEDVVAGIRTPLKISDLEDRNPKLYKEFVDIVDRLEKHYKDMQDMEFTIQEGKLYFLQTRTGKRTAQAHVRIASDMVRENLIDEKTAVLRVPPESIEQLLHDKIDPKAEREVIGKGLPASPGAAVGKIVFTAERAVEMADKGEQVILVRKETSPEDIEGMNAAKGILTSRGGMTSHAAVVARGMGKCCVAGSEDLKINYKTETCTIGDQEFKEGDYITLDGSLGEINKGKLPLIPPELSGDFGTIMDWANKYRKLGVRTNADTPKDSQTARKFGAEGIGLCRTEQMFFDENRIKSVRKMILADDPESKEKYIFELLPYQKEDFIGIFEAMEGLPVTIRLLDPPLHEFLPEDPKLQENLAKEMEISLDNIKAKIESLSEFNPMLGHRGCRLGITFPAIYDMQVQAIAEAAVEVKKSGKKVLPEIMIPLVGHVKEYTILEESVRNIVKKVQEEKGYAFDYKVGTMIEVPRASVTADQIAKHAEFFSFGTNDLTQMGCGFSRDDAGKFLGDYVGKYNIYPQDPFQSIDIDGIGELVRMSCEKGKMTRPDIKLGICGEHGGEPKSVEFCHNIGLNYVSCSPYRVPTAILAAAHAAIKEERTIGGVDVKTALERLQEVLKTGDIKLILKEVERLLKDVEVKDPIEQLDEAVRYIGKEIQEPIQKFMKQVEDIFKK